MNPLTLLYLYLIFVKIGFLGFGGGYAMLSLILQDAEALGITLKQFADLNALDMIVPGPIAINAATYIGYLTQGTVGSVLSTLGVILSSFVMVFLFLKSENFIRRNTYLNGALYGLKTSSVGLITAVALTLTVGTIFPGIENIWQISLSDISLSSIFPAAVVVVCGVAHLKFNVSPLLLTLLSGAVGFGLYFLI